MNTIPAPQDSWSILAATVCTCSGAGQGRPVAVMDSGLAGILCFGRTPWLRSAGSRKPAPSTGPGMPGVKPPRPELTAPANRLLPTAHAPGASWPSPPYILLGHSFGAINMLVYAYHYPSEVAGWYWWTPPIRRCSLVSPRSRSRKFVRRSFQFIAGLGRLDCYGCSGRGWPGCYCQKGSKPYPRMPGGVGGIRLTVP